MTVKITNSFSKYFNNPGLLLEGGLYGHMGHIHEDLDLTFEMLNSMIINLLNGEIDGEIKEKIDGQALAVSVDDETDDVIFARNVGNVKNWGEKSLRSWKQVHSKFSDVDTQEQKRARRDLIKAFTFAAKDLTSAISKLSTAVKDARFKKYDARVPKIDGRGNTIKDKDGKPVMETATIKNWLHFEILWPETTNVIPYNHRMIVLHNYVAYDVNGKKRVTSDFNQFATEIRDELKNIGAEKQKYFDITALPNLNNRWGRLDTPGKHVKIEDFSDKRDIFLNSVKKLQREYSLTDRDTIGDYYTGKLTEKIYDAAEKINYNVPAEIVNHLIDRWLHGIKKPTIAEIRQKVNRGSQIKKGPRYTDPGTDSSKKFADWIQSQESQLTFLMRTVRQDVERIVTDLGIEIMKNMNDYLALGTYNQSSADIKKAVERVIQQANQTKNPKHIDQINKYIDTIQRAGGLDKIVPSEGLMFTYKKPGQKQHSVYKLTGSFADLNQLVGFFKYGRKN